MPLFLGLLITGLAAWGSAARIAGAYGVGLYPPVDLLTAAMAMVAPWLAIFCGYLLWNNARVWRLAWEKRQAMASMVRAPEACIRHTGRPGPLERLGTLTLALGLAALPYWFEAAHPLVIVGTGLMVWVFLDRVLDELRRS